MAPVDPKAGRSGLLSHQSLLSQGSLASYGLLLRRVRDRLGSTGTVVTAVLLALVVTASASGFTLYRIRSGDTLSAIAARYHTTVARLVALNHLPGHGNVIFAGSTLRVPVPQPATPHWRTVPSPYVVRPGDSLYAIAARQHVDPRVIARRNH